MRRADNLTTFMCELSCNLGASTSSGPVQTCNGIALPLPLLKTVGRQYRNYGMRMQTRKLFSYGRVKVTSKVLCMRYANVTYKRPLFLVLCEQKAQNLLKTAQKYSWITRIYKYSVIKKDGHRQPICSNWWLQRQMLFLVGGWMLKQRRNAVAGSVLTL